MKIFQTILILLTIINGSFSQSSKPNIIYIYADDLGYGELGSYGQTKIKTPNLDRMAKEGIRFTQHYSSAPVCAPSRCMLMTGKHPGHSYIRGNYELGGFTDETEGGQMPLFEGAYTLAKMLKERGYATGMTGKWGMGVVGTTGSPLNHGFDYYYGYLDQKQAHNYYPTHLWENDHWDSLRNEFFMVHQKIDSSTATDQDFDRFIGQDYAPLKMTEKALNFIESNKDSSFFLYMPYTIPHLALQAPKKYVSQYSSQFDDKPYYGDKGYSPAKYPRATYAAMISILDEQVGMILDRIKDLNLDQNTIIFFSSDNGATFSAGVDTEFFNSVAGLRGLKMEVYEGGIRVPLIVRWPNKILPNQVTDHPSIQYDMMATLAELTGEKVINTDGVSLMPTLLNQGDRQEKHDFFYFEYPENGGQIAVRLGDWKGIKMNMKKNPNAPWELYNLKEDRNEKQDLSSKYPDIIEKMNEIVNKEHIHPHVREWEFIDSKLK